MLDPHSQPAHKEQHHGGVGGDEAEEQEQGEKPEEMKHVDRESNREGGWGGVKDGEKPEDSTRQSTGLRADDQGVDKGEALLDAASRQSAPSRSQPIPNTLEDSAVYKSRFDGAKHAELAATDELIKDSTNGILSRSWSPWETATLLLLAMLVAVITRCHKRGFRGVLQPLPSANEEVADELTLGQVWRRLLQQWGGQQQGRKKNSSLMSRNNSFQSMDMLQTDENQKEMELADLTVPILPKLVGSTSDPPTILNEEQLGKLWKALPTRYTICDWRLLYSTDQHGCSLRTFFGRTEQQGPSLLLVLDLKGHIFGGFASESWRPMRGYFGTGESFLVKVHPYFEVYTWQGSNSNFLFCGHDCLSFGGGRQFGLWLDSAFEYGSSGMCETFGNDPLGSAPEFKIIKVEVWGFK